MGTFKRQTYDNSYLFSLPGEMDKHHRKITEFILKAQRIDYKTADNFKGIAEDVKRFQRSSILYTVLMRNDVVLAYSTEELSAAFKVFSAKDIKNGDGNKVFIDVTGLIKEEDGYYTCRDIGKLCTYLFQAITWLLYDTNPLALMNNSNISISATECFVAMFDYMIGYFRFYGYSENRSKIIYLASLYFLIKVLGKDDDQYSRNLAAKISNVPQTNIKAFELYYNVAEDFVNIDTFITMIAKTFKLKGLTTEVFISKWIYICGTGTQFAPELFTAFSNMMIAAYCGAYVVNQRSIETQTKTSMVKFATSIMKLGVDEFDKRKFMESSELDTFVARDKNTITLKESLEARKQLPKSAIFTKEDFASKSNVKKRMNEVIKYYKKSDQENKIGAKLSSAIKLGIVCMDKSKIRDQYELGSIDLIVNTGRQYFTVSQKDSIKDACTEEIRVQTDYMKEARDDGNKELAKRLSKQLSELMRCKSNL
jgi:hypothetical protein